MHFFLLSYDPLEDPEARVANYTTHHTNGGVGLVSPFNAWLCVFVSYRKMGYKKWTEMKQSPLYVESHRNILAILHHLVFIIRETEEKQSSLAAGTVKWVMRA